MLQVEQIISSKAPGFFDKSPLITKPTISFLKRLFHESEVNQFLEQHGHCVGFEFIDRVLDHFNFGYQASQVDRRNKPKAEAKVKGPSKAEIVDELRARTDLRLVGLERAPVAALLELLELA